MTGTFPCCLKFAAVLEAPAIFICWNNGWAISTPISDQFPRKAYGVRCIHDGNDALDIYSAIQAARQMAITEERPILIEESRRKFIWEEMSYLERWWRDASDEMKESFINLVKNGQLEIVGGGWVMNDEVMLGRKTLQSQECDRLDLAYNCHLGEKSKDTTIAPCSSKKRKFITRDYDLKQYFGNSNEHSSSGLYLELMVKLRTFFGFWCKDWGTRGDLRYISLPISLALSVLGSRFQIGNVKHYWYGSVVNNQKVAHLKHDDRNLLVQMLSNKFNGKVPITLYNRIAALQIKTTLLLFLFFFFTVFVPFAIILESKFYF
ncbi:hypothetical protein JHK82_050426 [Glycine max]|nr:hypothetical protein JHK85_051063 [Glycine max]KAG5091648.1 hypothetical protein JHK82_050426 [Glycine max]